MNKKEFEIFCAKSLAGELGETEREKLEDLISRSDEFKREFEELKKIWELNRKNKAVEIPDPETEWPAVERRIEELENKTVKTSMFGSLLSLIGSPKLKPALSVGFASVILLAGIFFFRGEESKPVWITVATQNKEIKEVALPDGSTAKLNSGSEIKYLKNFDGESREIKLRGEAFFSVVKNGRAFVVSTGNSKTTVLGTKFDVKFREGVTKVIVKEGKVKLQPIKKETGGVVLTKNLAASVTANQRTSAVETVDADFLTGWLRGKPAFRHSPLGEIAGELERRYDVSVVVENDSLKSLTLTGSFESEDIDTTLSMICLALNLNYSKEKSGYTIKANNN